VLNFFRYVLLALLLLLVCLSSALLAMRFAIHGREVNVPALVGLSPADAEKAANPLGLVLSVENRYYSDTVTEGHIVSQSPAANASVRRGWRIRVAESLGPLRAAIPDVVGQSRHAAEVNLTRRGFNVGTEAEIFYPAASPNTVIAQNPPADSRGVASPEVGLILAAPDSPSLYVMPNFVGQKLPEASTAVEQAGFEVGHVDQVSSAPAGLTVPVGPGSIVRQFPAAGHKVTAGATITFQVLK